VLVLPPLIAAIAILLRRRMPELLAALLLFLAPLLPVLGLKPFDFQQYSTVADHYLYMPMIGVGLIIAALLSRLSSRAEWQVSTPRSYLPFICGCVLTAILCVALAIRAFDQTRYWRNSETLWSHNIRVNPQSWVSYLNLGEHFLKLEQPTRAQTLLEQSLAIRENDAAHLNLGVIDLNRGRVADAIEQFKRAIALKPRSVEAHVNLANAYGQAELFEDSIEAYRKALELEPTNEIARRMLPRVQGYMRTLQTRPTTTTGPLK
jgi:tetratricopeptide (TPR) repeat protein